MEPTEQLERDSRYRVILRDNGRCQKCGGSAVDVHEIVSRAAFGTATMHICFSDKNRVCLCRRCHDEVQGVSRWTSWFIKKLREQHGYEYGEHHFRGYI